MSSTSKFGRAMLEKYGWTDGKGLGRDESGMVEPIKIHGNFSANGLGHDVGTEFKNQWWDHVYNKAASNISVGESEDGSVAITRKEEHKISQKVIPYANASTSQYSMFVKAGETKPEEKDMSLKLSDAELFKLCGGKTAHKGARHGLTMSAKLARVKQQEQELMEKWQNSKEEHSQEVDEGNRIRKSKKKKRESVNDKEFEVCDSSPLKESTHIDIESTQPENLPKKHKKDKKKRKHDTEVCIEESSPQERSPKLSKKERKLLAKSEECLRTREQLGDPVQDENEEEVVRKKSKKKKKKARDGEKENDDSTDIVAFESEVVEKKKHKKKKRDRTESVIPEDPLDSRENIEECELNSDVHNDQCHKKKKKHKREK